MVSKNTGKDNRMERIEVNFNDPQDKANFQAMISELGIEDAPQDQLYLLTAMAYAGVCYEVS